MPATVSEQSTQVSQISELSPGLIFKYKVWRERGPYGDVRQDRATELGFWVVHVTMEEENRALFDIYSEAGDISDEIIVMKAVGTILERKKDDRLPAEQYGTYPVQEGFSTEINPCKTTDNAELEQLNDPYLDWMCGLHPKNGRNSLIPSRNVEPGTLHIIGGSAEE